MSAFGSKRYGLWCVGVPHAAELAMIMRFLKRLYKYTTSAAARYISKVGLFAVAVTIVSYWISYDDKIANRHESAWSTLRAAIAWTQAKDNRWGNVGQIDAIQSLTRHCDRWWRRTFLRPVFEIFFQDCVDLNSLSLERTELGGLKAASANLSHGDFACSNLTTANLRRANLQGVNFFWR